jgi:hypothetical protein
MLYQFKIDELIEEYGRKVLYQLHHCHFHLFELVWSQAERDYNNNFCQYGFKMETENDAGTII